ncbi:uncharacterized protein EURHEDRAFT_468329 [Aspergillus ruber CBS 135680]|uniref:Uncharacterized protein n=1 Tax=Aspergillus ruber (strain CBS 135680) TaxID=1388766 RepID=A0A017RZZ6_ASPRC|nr:uncharacterized protein EURHEDRAFT_468329 [Aspergillus ruber CBS 135680]EYE89959.1 hypothetical protein EURHEDRAFT_468329 [Aspergillus ruber CBS 135680]
MLTIDARNILLRPNDIPKDISLQLARYTTPKRLLHTRILDRLTLDILQQAHTDHTQHPSEILSHLDTVYGVSLAEERLLLVKMLMNLRPNGNAVAMMRQWQRLTTEIERKKYYFSEPCHDIGIIFLGDFQRSFICTQLDSLFPSSKRGRFHEIDMDDISIKLRAVHHLHHTPTVSSHTPSIDRILEPHSSHFWSS